MSAVDPGRGALPPRLVVVRSFADTKAVVAMAHAGRAVVVVLRTDDADRRRVLDLLAGWALGAGGELDRVSPNTVLVRPPGTDAVRLGRTGMVAAVEDVFAADGAAPLTRDEEERLLPLAASGLVSAQRRIVDAYGELATLFALRVRPRAVTEAMAVQIAQDELDRLVRHPPRRPLLASLCEGIISRLVP